MGIRSAIQIGSKSIFIWRSTINLPGTILSSINGFLSRSLVYKAAIAALGINNNSALGRAGRFQHTAVGVLPVVIYPVTQGDDPFGAGGNQLNLAPFPVGAGSGVSTGIRRSIDFNPMDGQIAGGLDGHVVQIILKGIIRILGGFHIGAAGMDFAAYGYLTTIDIYTMICVNRPIVVFRGSIFRVTGCDRTNPGIDIDCIQCHGFPDISLQCHAAATSLNVQAGVVQIGFLNEAYGGIPANSCIIPGIVIAVANSQERSTVVWLSAAAPAGPFGIAIDLAAIIAFRPVGTAGIPEFRSCCPVFIGDQPFRPGYPIEAILMARIRWILRIWIGGRIIGLIPYAGPLTTDPECFLRVRGRQGIFQRCRNSGQITIPRIGSSTGFS